VKIRTAIFGVYVLASAVGLAVLMRFMLAEVRPRYVDSLRRTLQDTADVLAAVLGVQEEGWENELQAIRQSQPNLRIQIVSADGQIYFDSSLPGEGYAITGFAKSVAARLIDGEAPADDSSIGARAEIASAGGAARGWVVVSRPLRSVNAFIWSERKKLVSGAAVIAAVMVAAGWWIAERLTHSLERLTAYAEAVRDGRDGSPPPSRATEIVALSRAFEEMRVALEGKAYVERYTQALSHELKAPLSAIRGAAELLQEEMPAEERAKFLANLRSESARLQQVVDRMLRLSALEARRGLEAVEPVDLSEVLRETENAMRPVAAAVGVTLTCRIPAHPVVVRGERFLLVQAVTNLLQNAVEFSPENGIVELSLTERDDAVVVDVLDRGPGVPDFAREKIFERFFSLPRPRTARKSTGLGLSFVREIVALHDGVVGVENRPDGGARAWLRLPLARAG
jgi:two-component system, OmpR family, sensor histidine kinase CreC